MNKYCTHRDIKLLKWVTESLFRLSWLCATVFLSVSMNVWGLGLKSSKILYILYFCQVLNKRGKPGTCKGSIKGSGERRRRAEDHASIWWNCVRASEQDSTDGECKQQPWQHLRWDTGGEQQSSRSFWADHPRGNQWKGELPMWGSYWT